MYNNILIIYPCDFGNINKVDEDYAFEKAIADKNGIKTIMFNFDEYMTMGTKLKLNITNLGNVDDKEIFAIYRGWMMKPEQYESFYTDLYKSYRIKLINTPLEYASAHCFNMAYDKIMDYTPKIAVFSEGEVKYIDWNNVKAYFNKKFIIKDYVKSVKDWDFPEYFDCTYTDEELDKWLNKFIELRGDLYTGGIIFKEYVELDRTNGKTHEFRAFYYKGRLITLYCNSNNEEDLNSQSKLNKHEKLIKQVKKFAELVPKLNSQFYTIDFAIKKNGDIIIIETGDGQVSGLPSPNEAEQLYEYFVR